MVSTKFDERSLIEANWPVELEKTSALRLKHVDNLRRRTGRYLKRETGRERVAAAVEILMAYVLRPAKESLKSLRLLV